MMNSQLIVIFGFLKYQLKLRRKISVVNLRLRTIWEMGLGFCLRKSILTSSIDSINEHGTLSWRGVPTVWKIESKLSTGGVHLLLLSNCRHTVCSCFRLLWTVPSSNLLWSGYFSPSKRKGKWYRT